MGNMRRADQQRCGGTVGRLVGRQVKRTGRYPPVPHQPIPYPCCRCFCCPHHPGDHTVASVLGKKQDLTDPDRTMRDRAVSLGPQPGSWSFNLFESWSFWGRPPKFLSTRINENTPQSTMSPYGLFSKMWKKGISALPQIKITCRWFWNLFHLSPTAPRHTMVLCVWAF